MVDITNALAIDGWMSDPELVWLAQQAQTHKVIVELGSYLGRSTRAIADHTEGFVIAIDDWQGPRDVEKVDIDLWEQFNFANAALIAAQKIRPVRFDHTNLQQLSISFEPDMIFIDGAHDYMSVMRDIDWAKKCVKKGLICGHDAAFEGVALALQEQFPHYKVIQGASIWYQEV